jgi:hypothetical protein
MITQLLLTQISVFAQTMTPIEPLPANLDSNLDTTTLAQNNPGETPSIPDTRGIEINSECLLNGQCSFRLYEFLNIRESAGYDSSPELFVQDILLSATFFIGTILTIAFIVSWLLFIFAGASGNSSLANKGKAGIKNSIIWFLLVICSYTIIRIVQYIAKWL